MNILIFGHIQGCTPFTPCASCEIVAFLREKLEADDYAEFVKRAQEATETVAKPIPTRASIHTLGLSPRVCRSLVNEGVSTVGDVLKKRKVDLHKIPNLGRVSFAEIETALRWGGRRIEELVK